MRNAKAGISGGPAVRNQYLLHYVISGCGTYVVGGETYTLHAGSCFLIRPGERTLYTADRKDPWEYMWVAFDGFDVLEILRRTGLVNRYVVAVENGEEFARYLREMIEEFSGGSLFKVMSCFYGAMSVLEKSAHGGAYTREHEYVNKAIGYIKSNYGYPIQVSDLARYIGIDRTYLYRIFFALESMSAEAVPDAGAHQRRQKDAPERRVHRGGNRAVLRLFGRLLLLQPLQALHRHDAEGVYFE